MGAKHTLKERLDLITNIPQQFITEKINGLFLTTFHPLQVKNSMHEKHICDQFS